MIVRVTCVGLLSSLQDKAAQRTPYIDTCLQQTPYFCPWEKKALTISESIPLNSDTFYAPLSVCSNGV